MFLVELEGAKSVIDESNVVLIGGGGHGRSVLEVLRECGFKVRGYVDAHQVPITQLTWLGEDLSVVTPTKSDSFQLYFPGAGDNWRRQSDVEQASLLKLRLCAPAISPRSNTAQGVEVGLGSVIMPGATVRTGSKIGVACIVNSGAVVDHDSLIEDYAHIGPGVTVAGGVKVREGAFLGAGSTVIPNLEIGTRSVLGAGSVAIHDLDPNAIYVGVPARRLRASRTPW